MRANTLRWRRLGVVIHAPAHRSQGVAQGAECAGQIADLVVALRIRQRRNLVACLDLACDLGEPEDRLQQQLGDQQRDAREQHAEHHECERHLDRKAMVGGFDLCSDRTLLLFIARLGSRAAIEQFLHGLGNDLVAHLHLVAHCERGDDCDHTRQQQDRDESGLQAEAHVMTPPNR